MAPLTLVFALVLLTASHGQGASGTSQLGRTWGLFDGYGTGYGGYYSGYPSYYGDSGSDYGYPTYGNSYNTYGSYGSYGTYGDYGSGYYRSEDSAPVVEEVAKVKRSVNQADNSANIQPEGGQLEGRHRPGSYNRHPPNNRYPSYGNNRYPSQFAGSNRYPSYGYGNNRYPSYGGSGYPFGGYSGYRPAYGQRPANSFGSSSIFFP